MNPQLAAIAIQITPQVIDLLKSIFKKTNPKDPQPTDEQVIAAYRAAFESSLAKDDEWLATHPE